MNTLAIMTLAQKDGKLSGAELEARLTALRSMNWQLLQCIAYVRYNQDCSLTEAKGIVLDSAAWADEQARFIQHQEAIQQEFLEFAKEEGKTIIMAISPEGMQYKITK